MAGRGSIVSQDSQHYKTLSALGRLRAAAFAKLTQVLAIVIKSHGGIVLHRSVHATNDEDCQGTVMFAKSDERPSHHQPQHYHHVALHSLTAPYNYGELIFSQRNRHGEEYSPIHLTGFCWTLKHK